MWARDAESFNATFGAVLDAHRAALGLAAVDDVRSHVFSDHPWLAADLSLVDDGPDCLAVGEVDHHALFPQVAAVVHHGGAGITTAAALAGAPQVVIPQGYDQHYWARRIEQLGIGVAHARGAPNGASLTTALEATLRYETTARAGSVAKAVRRDGAELAAERLLSTAEQ